MDPYTLLCQYSLRFPQELLWIEVSTVTREDLLLIYKGQTSSLMQGTPADEYVSLWDPDYQIKRIDRIKAPYNPNQPVILESGITLERLAERLKTV